MARPEIPIRLLSPALLVPLLAVFVVSTGCRSAVPFSGGVEAPGGAAVQVLLRVEAELNDERESFRAVVRRWSGGELEVRVNDPLGRAVWRVEASGGVGRWSGRDAEACRFVDRIAAPIFGVAWPLSAEELGRWLLGEAPPAGIEPGQTSAQSDTARRWTFEWAGDELAGWTVVDAEGRRLEGARAEGRATLLFAEANLRVEWSESRREIRTGLDPPVLTDLADLSECRDASGS